MKRAELDALKRRCYAYGMLYISHPGSGEPSHWVFPDKVCIGPIRAAAYAAELEERGNARSADW